MRPTGRRCICRIGESNSRPRRQRIGIAPGKLAKRPLAPRRQRKTVQRAVRRAGELGGNGSLLENHVRVGAAKTK